jgi:hypothetical protein
MATPARHVAGEAPRTEKLMTALVELWQDSVRGKLLIEGAGYPLSYVPMVGDVYFAFIPPTPPSSAEAIAEANAMYPDLPPLAPNPAEQEAYVLVLDARNDNNVAKISITRMLTDISEAKL